MKRDGESCGTNSNGSGGNEVVEVVVLAIK